MYSKFKLMEDFLFTFSLKEYSPSFRGVLMAVSSNWSHCITNQEANTLWLPDFLLYFLFIDS